MLQIAPSKTDNERLPLVSPELGEVSAAIINRVRDGRATMPWVAVYDHHQRVWNPPAPVLFQRRRGPTDHHVAPETIRRFIHCTLAVSGPIDTMLILFAGFQIVVLALLADLVVARTRHHGSD